MDKVIQVWLEDWSFDNEGNSRGAFVVIARIPGVMDDYLPAIVAGLKENHPEQEFLVEDEE